MKKIFLTLIAAAICAPALSFANDKTINVEVPYAAGEDAQVPDGFQPMPEDEAKEVLFMKAQGLCDGDHHPVQLGDFQFRTANQASYGRQIFYISAAYFCQQVF